MKVGARNKLLATVTDVRKSSIMCQVKLDISSGQISSVMTADSATEMNLREGDKVHVIVKEIHVLLIKDKEAEP